MGSFSDSMGQQWQKQLRKTRQAVMRWYFHQGTRAIAFPAFMHGADLESLRCELASELKRYPLEVVAEDWTPFARIEVRRVTCG